MPNDRNAGSADRDNQRGQPRATDSNSPSGRATGTNQPASSRDGSEVVNPVGKGETLDEAREFGRKGAQKAAEMGYNRGIASGGKVVNEEAFNESQNKPGTPGDNTTGGKT